MFWNSYHFPNIICTLFYLKDKYFTFVTDKEVGTYKFKSNLLQATQYPMTHETFRVTKGCLQQLGVWRCQPDLLWFLSTDCTILRASYHVSHLLSGKLVMPHDEERGIFAPRTWARLSCQGPSSLWACSPLIQALSHSSSDFKKHNLDLITSLMKAQKSPCHCTITTLQGDTLLPSGWNPNSCVCPASLAVWPSWLSRPFLARSLPTWGCRWGR